MADRTELIAKLEARLKFEDSNLITGALLREAIAALSAPSGEWMPIESAPKDGTSILTAHDEAAIVCYWQVDRTVDGEPGWADGATDSDGYFYTYPVTHWVPLRALHHTGGGGMTDEDEDADIFFWSMVIIIMLVRVGIWWSKRDDL